MSPLRFSRFRLVLFLVLCISPILRAADFKPVSPAELAMKDNPASPGDHAMVLEWTRTQNDVMALEEDYYRIKIFDDAGKKYADVEIPFAKDIAFEVNDIHARTVHPDGTIVPFNGKVYSKWIVKGKGVKYLAKTFSFSDVQPGSVLEYKYRKGWDPHYVVDTHWILQSDLFIKKAHFRLLPNLDTQFGNLWQAFRLPPGKDFKTNEKQEIELELEDIPAIADEQYSPPEGELKMRFDFFYREDRSRTVQAFWKDYTKHEYNDAEDFIGDKRSGVVRAVNSTVSPTDDLDTKLRKIYVYVQGLRNISYDAPRTDQEEKREKLKVNKTADDVIKNGYGTSADLNRLYIAMARAAGAQAFMAKVCERDERFFNINTVNPKQLNSYVVRVSANGKDFWLDPGTPLLPYGLLPWQKTSTAALVLDPATQFEFKMTQEAAAKETVIRRVADLNYQEGELVGQIMLGFSGQEALEHRLSAKRGDLQGVKEEIEKDLKEMLPTGSRLKLQKIENVDRIGDDLKVTFDASIPDPGASAGSRYMLPPSIFEHGSKPFTYEKRANPIYLPYSYQVLDTVLVHVPEQYQLEVMPNRRHIDAKFGQLDEVWSAQGNTLKLDRTFAIGGLLYQVDSYPAIRDFYSQVANSDQESFVLRANQTSASNPSASK